MPEVYLAAQEPAPSLRISTIDPHGGLNRPLVDAGQQCHDGMTMDSPAPGLIIRIY